jgi:hypothetical protein
LPKCCIDSNIEISLSQVLKELVIQNVELPDMDVRLPKEETPGSTQKWRSKCWCNGKAFYDDTVLPNNCKIPQNMM